jgi:hypothetical protein
MVFRRGAGAKRSLFRQMRWSDLRALVQAASGRRLGLRRGGPTSRCSDSAQGLRCVRRILIEGARQLSSQFDRIDSVHRSR